MTLAEIQQALIEAGYQVCPTDLTPTVIEFQHTHVDQLGHALAVDGIVGPATKWALQHPGAHPGGYVAPGWRCAPAEARGVVTQVLQAAVGEVGVHEEPDGSNRGPRVDLYTKPDLGEPWCAAFVSWCWARADGGSPFGRILSAMGILSWGKDHGRVVTDLKSGDVWIIPRGGGHGHCGLVADILDGQGKIATLEGNASNAVRGLVRAVSSFAGIVRPIGDMT